MNNHKNCRHHSLFASVASASVVSLLASSQTLASETSSNPSPDTLELTGIVRDFHEKSESNGHQDFENRPDEGFSLYCGNVAENLGLDGKPIFTGEGKKITQQWTNSGGMPICHTLFNPAMGDQAGVEAAESTGGINSAASFAQWYRDVPGVNMSNLLSLTFVKQADGSYVFDDEVDPVYSERGGFFPIDDQLLGNSDGAPNHNYHFTFELHTTFKYEAGAGQMFQFSGDDDVWVFINGKLVIDLGGIHSSKNQFVMLDRLDLVDGVTYPLSFFFAERHRTESNFRIQTNINLESDEPPTVTAVFD